jgi:hypothetical protein
MPSQDDGWLDGTLYPDVKPPLELDDLADRVDFLVRLCAAWDFGLLPSSQTVAEIRQRDWREAVEACRLLTSPAYHLLRAWHHLPPLPYLGRQEACIRDDPSLAFV